MKDIDRVISQIMRVGLLLAITLVAMALILGVLGGQIGAGQVLGQPDGGPGAQANAQASSLASLLTDLRHGQPGALVLVGVIILVLTPISRVLAAWILFLRGRDWIFVGITSLVLGIITASVFI